MKGRTSRPFFSQETGVNTEEFLDRILPATGTKYWTSSGTDFRQKSATNITALAADALKAISHNKDIFVAVGSYKDRRTKADAEDKKAFYVDIDVGPEANKYPDKAAAVKALLSFGNEFLPPSIIVSSGGGIHGYWTLEDPISVSEWQPVADLLKGACKVKGFHADDAVTADSARIMRVPGSVNHKNQKPVAVIHEGPDYTLDAIKEKLQPQLNVIQNTLGSFVDNNDLLAGETFEQQTYYAKEIVELCPMYSQAMTDGGKGLSEPLWMQQLKVLTLTEDGYDYAHQISKGHASYNQTATEQKWARQKASDVQAPTLCSTFESLGSAKCKDCRHKVRGLKSPLHLGTEKARERFVTNYLPGNWGQDKEGVFQWIRTDNDEKPVVKMHRILDVNISNVSLALNEDTGTIFSFDVEHTTSKNIKKKTVSYDEDAPLGTKQQFGGILKQQGSALTISDMNMKGLEEFTVAWARQIRKEGRLYTAYSTLGWHNDVFVLPDYVYTPDGRKEQNMTRSQALAHVYTPEGEAQPWIDAAQLICSTKRYEGVATILTAFASPLVYMLREAASVMSFVSPQSGTGKTTTMIIAQAVWGKPREAMSQLNDTDAAISHKMGYIKNLPSYWDEVRVTDDPVTFINNIFKYVQGREKSRMTQNIELREARVWETMMVLGSNESIADHANATNPNSEAGRVRIFEVEVPPITKDQGIGEQLSPLRLELDHNYGVIGHRYAEFLAKNQKKIQNMVRTVRNEYGAGVKDEGERFWLNTVSTLYVAAKIVKAHGWMDIDLPEFKAWLDNQLDNQRKEIMSTYSTIEERNTDAISQFIHRNRSHIVYYSHLPQRGAAYKPANQITSAGEIAYGEVVGAVYVEDKIFRVSKTALEKFVKEVLRSSPKYLTDSDKYVARKASIRPEDTIRGKVYDIKLSDDQFETA